MNRLALLVVGIHAAVLLGHNYAHGDLGVELVLWQTLFAYSVIVLAPLAAAALTFTARARTGYALLAVSMIGALAFGFFHHYVQVSPDHVDHLPHGDTQALFRTTAAWMVALEVAGATIGAVGASRTTSAAPDGE